MSTIVAASQVLDTAKEYLENIKPEQYSRKEELLSGATIGEHTRHFVEFFQCLLAQTDEGSAVNYGKRLRNKQLENDPRFALNTIEQIQKEISILDTNLSINVPCKIETQMDGNDLNPITTTIERELLYNIEHTIHHLAIIKIGLKIVAPEISVSDHFGVAASTLEFRKHNQQKSTSFVEHN